MGKARILRTFTTQGLALSKVCRLAYYALDTLRGLSTTLSQPTEESSIVMCPAGCQNSCLNRYSVLAMDLSRSQMEALEKVLALDRITIAPMGVLRGALLAAVVGRVWG